MRFSWDFLQNMLENGHSIYFKSEVEVIVVL